MKTFKGKVKGLGLHLILKTTDLQKKNAYTKLLAATLVNWHSNHLNFFLPRLEPSPEAISIIDNSYQKSVDLSFDSRTTIFFKTTENSEGDFIWIGIEHNKLGGNKFQMNSERRIT